MGMSSSFRSGILDNEEFFFRDHLAQNLGRLWNLHNLVGDVKDGQIRRASTESKQHVHYGRQ